MKNDKHAKKIRLEILEPDKYLENRDIFSRVDFDNFVLPKSLRNKMKTIHARKLSQVIKFEFGTKLAKSYSGKLIDKSALHVVENETSSEYPAPAPRRPKEEEKGEDSEKAAKKPSPQAMDEDASAKRRIISIRRHGRGAFRTVDAARDPYRDGTGSLPGRAAAGRDHDDRCPLS